MEDHDHWLARATDIFTRVPPVDDPELIDEAVHLFRQVVAAAPSGIAGMRLSGALLHRFYRLGNLHDLDEAIAVARGVLAEWPDVSAVSNLAAALNARFLHHGEKEDIDEAVRLAQVVVRTVSAGHPQLAGFVTNLGSFLE